MHPLSNREEEKAPMWVTFLLVVGLSAVLWTLIIVSFRAVIGAIF